MRVAGTTSAKKSHVITDPLVDVGRWLAASGYRFIVPTPETHRRVNARPEAAIARSVRDALGWSRPFPRALLPAAIVDALFAADALSERDGLLASKVRFATLGDALYVHSSYPTDSTHAVFFGPDTYRFCSALARLAPRAARIVDVGCGSGAGALTLADRGARLVLADRNPIALRYARVNAALAGVEDRVELVGGDLLEEVHGTVDLVIANPPYIADEHERLYCHGGGELGTGVAVRIVEQALARLVAGGKLLLYTGAPIVDGEDRFRAAVAPLLDNRARWTYDELDPDVFGEELDRDAYASVERIAVVVLAATRL